ncbi:MAG: FG-GAP-like repeat-containing protein [Acidimicrobiales bacterium]
MQLRRNRSTRSLWDPAYVDETWIADVVRLVPRLRQWVATSYPGTRTAITEYNWGAEGHINGATAQADVLGIFGREGLDMATRWVIPDASTPTYKAIKLFRNYDGAGGAFGDTSLRASVPNPDELSAFAAVRASDGALTVMVVNKVLSGTTPVTVSLAAFAPGAAAQAWQLTSANAIRRLADVPVAGAGLSLTVPAQSVTLLVVPAAPTLPALSVDDVSVVRGATAPAATFTVSLSSVASATVAVDYATSNGTATAGTDYTTKAGTVSFAPGTRTQAVPVGVLPGVGTGVSQTFFLSLSRPSGATIADGQGQATILNRRLPPTDFNGDGKADLLWHNQSTGDLYVWLLNGTVTTAGSYLTPSRFADTSWQIRGLADFNGDGRTDLVWHNQATGDLYVWFMNGTVATGGSYLTPARFADTRWQIRGVADFNGDGKADLLWHNQATGDLYVWFMNGTAVSGGSYLTPSRFADTRWQIRGVADLDGDGKPDVLWHHQTSGDLYAWLMNGTVAAGGSYLTPRSFSDTHWKLALVADFDADGKPDLLWHNQQTGDLYVWLMKGMVTTGGSYLTPSRFSDTSWQVVPR